MKRRAVILTVAVIAVALILIFGLKDYDASKGQWKFGAGKGYIGDWVEFKGQPYKLNADTIYRSNQPVAVIRKVTKHKMQIINLLNGDEAFYFNKAK